MIFDNKQVCDILVNVIVKCYSIYNNLIHNGSVINLIADTGDVFYIEL